DPETVRERSRRAARSTAAESAPPATPRSRVPRTHECRRCRRAVRAWPGARRARRTGARSRSAPPRPNRSETAPWSIRGRAARAAARRDPIRPAECPRRAAAAAPPQPAPGCSRDRRGVLQFFGLVVRDDVVEDFCELAVEHVGEPVAREVDAMIGDAVFLEIAGPNFSRALARAHLAAPILRDRFLLLAQLHLVEARAQNLHRLRLVLDLRLLVLLRDDHARGDMRDADGGVRRVDALPAGTARAE